ncbi:MAG: hypothetical protein OEL20_11195 [Sulfuritalea sp.]|nr:hypothetical protein [Sulfuritalea sp.]
MTAAGKPNSAGRQLDPRERQALRNRTACRFWLQRHGAHAASLFTVLPASTPEVRSIRFS